MQCKTKTNKENNKLQHTGPTKPKMTKQETKFKKRAPFCAVFIETRHTNIAGVRTNAQTRKNQ